jgi:hypothetical protein
LRSYEEQEKRAYEKAEKLIAENKRRKSIVRSTAAFIAGTAAILAIGVFTNAMTPPPKPTAESSGIVSETETTSAEPAKTTTVTKKTDISKTTAERTKTTVSTVSAMTTVSTATTTHTEPSETEPSDTEPSETEPQETEPAETAEATKRTKAPRTTSRLRSVDATWTEAVPIPPDPNTKKMAAPKLFDPDEIYNNTDIVFDGTIINTTEYEVTIDYEDGHSNTKRVTVLDVTVDYIYYGKTDKDIVKVVWKAPLSEQASSLWQKPIVNGSEYIFMTQELSEEYPDTSFAYRYADYELLNSRWCLIPVHGDIAGIYYEYFKDDEEAAAMSVPKENISDMLPEHMRNYYVDNYFYKDDLIELLKKFFE